MKKSKSKKSKPAGDENLQLLRLWRRDIGRVLYEVRVERGLTLSQLARETRFTADRLDRFEMGRDAIRLEDILRLARALETPFNILMEF